MWNRTVVLTKADNIIMWIGPGPGPCPGGGRAHHRLEDSIRKKCVDVQLSRDSSTFAVSALGGVEAEQMGGGGASALGEDALANLGGVRGGALGVEKAKVVAGQEGLGGFGVESGGERRRGPDEAA